MQNKTFTYNDYLELSEGERQIIVKAIIVKLQRGFIYMNDWQVVKRMYRLCYNNKYNKYTFESLLDLIEDISYMIECNVLHLPRTGKQFNFQSKFSYWGDGFLLMLGQKKGNVPLSFDMWMG